MTIREIVICGDPVLHLPAAPVTECDAALRQLVDDMFETCEAAPGVGLAAPQVGVGKRLFIWDYDQQDEGPARGVAINPKLWITPAPTGRPDSDEYEGCLSFPGERFGLRRGAEAILEATDIEGNAFRLHATGWFARILQHEYDHLNGTLYVDRLADPHKKAAERARRRNRWGVPGLSWLPGRDDIDA